MTETTPQPKKKQRSDAGKKRAPYRPREKPPEESETETAPVERKNGGWKAASAEAGATYLVRALHLLSRGVAWMAGATLAPLSDEQLAEGTREAMPLVGRFPVLLTILSFVGFPVWLAKMLAENLTFPQKKEEKRGEGKVIDLKAGGQ